MLAISCDLIVPESGVLPTKLTPFVPATEIASCNDNFIFEKLSSLELYFLFFRE